MFLAVPSLHASPVPQSYMKALLVRQICKLFTMTLIHKKNFTRATVPLSTTLSGSGEVLNAVTAILSNSIIAPRSSVLFEGSVMDIGGFISNTTIEYIDNCDGEFEEIRVHMPTGNQISIVDPERMEMFGNSVEMPKPECTTVGGPDPNKPCVFPFKHKGNTFITCALAPNDDKHWCSTLVDEAGEHIAANGNWGHCGLDCPFCSSGA